VGVAYNLNAGYFKMEDGIKVSNSSNLYLETPLLQSTCLSNRFGYNVYLKLENVQPAGSFKIRGIGNRCKKVTL
jgi:threonine dehydratase